MLSAYEMGIGSADFMLEYPSASEVEDLGAHARMDGDVCQQPGFRDHGASVHEAQDNE